MFSGTNYTKDIGESPAAVNRRTGILYINPKRFYALPPEQRAFVIFHEAGHYYHNTSSEMKADEAAFRWYIAQGLPLSQSVKALSEVLDINKDSHRKRIFAQIQRAKQYDKFVNGSPTYYLTKENRLQKMQEYINKQLAKFEQAVAAGDLALAAQIFKSIQPMLPPEIATGLSAQVGAVLNQAQAIMAYNGFTDEEGFDDDEEGFDDDEEGFDDDEEGFDDDEEGFDDEADFDGEEEDFDGDEEDHFCAGCAAAYDGEDLDGFKISKKKTPEQKTAQKAKTKAAFKKIGATLKSIGKVAVGGIKTAITAATGVQLGTGASDPAPQPNIVVNVPASEPAPQMVQAAQAIADRATEPATPAQPAMADPATEPATPQTEAEKKKAMKKWLIWGGIGVGAIILIVLLIMWWKRRKKSA